MRPQARNCGFDSIRRCLGSLLQLCFLARSHREQGLHQPPYCLESGLETDKVPSGNDPHGSTLISECYV